MSYADTLLAAGETIHLRRRQHWLALLIEARAAFGLWVLAILLLWVSGAIFKDGALHTLFSYAGLIGLLAGVLWFAWQLWNWLSEEYLVTNHRLLKVEGIFSKRAADSSLEKINDAVLTQGVLGRMLNYGNLTILTAAEQTVDDYHMLAGPKQFKIEMLNAKNALEGDFDSRRMPPPPTPPMRAAGVAMPPPAAAPMPTGAPPSSDSAEVTATLARLADLRDKGAISAEEYDAKKKELLGRL